MREARGMGGIGGRNVNYLGTIDVMVEGHEKYKGI
jgi:hypothetical protein